MSDEKKADTPNQNPAPQESPRPEVPRMPIDRIEKSESNIPGERFGR